MVLQDAKFCPVCYTVYVGGMNVRTGEPISQDCIFAKTIRGAPEADVTGLVIKDLQSKDRYIGVIVLRDNDIRDRENFDFPLSLRDRNHREIKVHEPSYLGVHMSGPHSHRSGLPDITEDPTLVNGAPALKDYGYGAGLEAVPLRKLWGGHGFYAKATPEDLVRLQQAIRGERFPPSWNESVPFDKLHVSPNPFFD